jgi:hypothetical protein
MLDILKLASLLSFIGNSAARDPIEIFPNLHPALNLWTQVATINQFFWAPSTRTRFPIKRALVLAVMLLAAWLLCQTFPIQH